jgi:beta-galactosidase
MLLMMLFSCPVTLLYAQEISMSESAALEQVYGETIESSELKPFNELNVELGYVLYETKITVASADAVLVIENVRDYAAVFADSMLQGTVTNSQNRLRLKVGAGEYTLRLYAENIGRITYGPEITDNAKGLFGSITLDGEAIEGWKITPLQVKGQEVKDLRFTPGNSGLLPRFYKGFFSLVKPAGSYLDLSGWGMGEVWVNGQYIGAYWENEKLKSIQVPAELLRKEKNEVVVFELKGSKRTTIKQVNAPVFN